jgi:hypothetical protein
VHQLITSPHNGTFFVARPNSQGGMRTRPFHPTRNESCGDCGGTGANSSGETCGTCNGLGDVHCLVGRRGARVPSRSMIRKEGH